MNFVLIGAAGSGKGTLAAAMAAHFQLAVFDTGARLRQITKEDTELARRLKTELAAGHLAPPGLVLDILADATRTVPPGATGWVIDGTPRTIEQAQYLVEHVRQGALQLDGAIVLTVAPETVQARCMDRVLCDRCGAIYNRRTAPPPSPDRCHATCGGALIQRAEDTPAAIAKRLEIFARETAPTIPLLAAAGIPVYTFDADRPVAALHADVFATITPSRAPAPEMGAATSAIPRPARSIR